MGWALDKGSSPARAGQIGVCTAFFESETIKKTVFPSSAGEDEVVNEKTGDDEDMIVLLVGK